MIRIVFGSFAVEVEIPGSQAAQRSSPLSQDLRRLRLDGPSAILERLSEFPESSCQARRDSLIRLLASGIKCQNYCIYTW